MRSGKKPESRSHDGASVTGAGAGKERNVGDALRAVYREAVDETIPDELLELLKKLD